MTHKYNARPTTVDGIRFHSKKEAKRYQDLKLLERAGQIRNLTLQPRYPLEVNGRHVCEYRGDFRFFDMRTGRTVLEDVKGMKSGAAYQMFQLKKKLMLACHGIEVQEV